MTTEIREMIAKAVLDVRSTRPLIGSVTNAVSVNFVTNAQLAVGGSAAVVYLEDESKLLAGMGDAFYVNMGTLLPVHGKTIPNTAKQLDLTGTPWVLDPVGIGIGSLRTKVLMKLKTFRPTVIRGNPSEIIALANLWGVTDGGECKTRGVDTTESVSDAKDAAVALAKWIDGAVAVSGETDMITDGEMTIYSEGGSPMMESITGSGCSLGGVAAVYSAVTSPFIAAITATAAYNLAGRKAAARSEGVGSFQSIFLDELYNASAEDIANNPLRMEE